MKFANPQLLWLFLIYVPLIVWYVKRRRSASPTVLLSTTKQFDSLGTSWKVVLMHLMFVAKLLAIGCGIIILCRPQSYDSWSTSETEGTDIVVAMDVSTSMLAKDFNPTRLDAAKDVATQFVTGRESDNIGLVIFAGEADARTIEEFRKQNIPVVLVNNRLDLDGLLCVSADHYGGAVQATAHLCERGHRKIGLLAGRFSPQVSEARAEGFFKTLAQYDVPVDTRFIADIEPTLEAGEEAMTRLLREPDHPTAFFCTNDTIAAGAMKAVFRAGLKMPEDIAIVGFDDSYISRVVAPELTTVKIDVDLMGRLAAQRLFDLIDGNEVTENQIEIPTELIVRETT